MRENSRLRADWLMILLVLFAFASIAWPVIKPRLDCAAGIKAACEQIEAEHRKEKPDA